MWGVRPKIAPRVISVHAGNNVGEKHTAQYVWLQRLKIHNKHKEADGLNVAGTLFKVLFNRSFRFEISVT